MASPLGLQDETWDGILFNLFAELPMCNDNLNVLIVFEIMSTPKSRYSKVEFETMRHSPQALDEVSPSVIHGVFLAVTD